MKYLLVLLAGMLVFTSCTDSGVNEYHAVEDNVFLLEGETLVPNGPTASFFNDNKKLKGVNFQDISEEQKKALKETLLNYSKKKKSSFVAFISYKKDNKFKYRYFRLNPNKEDLEASSGKNLFKYIIFVDPETKEPYRVIAAIIPDTKNQKQAVLDWASRFGFKLENKKTKTTSSMQKTTMHCYWQEVGYFDPELGGIYHEYTIWVCEEQTLDPGGDDGGGTGCDYSGGSCEEDPPPTNDGGGGSTGDPDNDPCPDGYEEDANGNCITIETDPEPCDTNNPVLDNQYIQTKLDELWADTNYGPDSNPNPENQRKEQVAIIASNGYGGYQFFQLDVQSTSCIANFGVPNNLPNDAILVHTHPFKKGDILQCTPGRSYEYDHQPGKEDRPTLDKVGLEQGIILDAEKIIMFTPDESETPTLIDRCGY